MLKQVYTITSYNFTEDSETVKINMSVNNGLFNMSFHYSKDGITFYKNTIDIPNGPIAYISNVVKHLPYVKYDECNELYIMHNETKFGLRYVDVIAESKRGLTNKPNSIYDKLVNKILISKMSVKYPGISTSFNFYEIFTYTTGMCVGITYDKLEFLIDVEFSDKSHIILYDVSDHSRLGTVKEIINDIVPHLPCSTKTYTLEHCE